MMQVDLNEGTVEAKEMQNGEILQAQSIMQHSQVAYAVFMNQKDYSFPLLIAC